LGEYLRHRESSYIDPMGFSPVGELSIELQLSTAEIMDAALFSYHGKHGWRYDIEWEQVELGEEGSPPPQNPHTISDQGWRATIRANRKHSIEIITTDGVLGGGKDKGKGKSKGNRH
jgi:hypothetical protein